MINTVITKLIRYIRNSLFAKNTGWMIFEKIYQIILSLVVGLLSARYLGPANYGVINYVAAFVAFGSPICGLGLQNVLTKTFVDEGYESGDAIGTSLFMEFVTSVVVSVLVVMVVAISNAGDSVVVVIAALESLVLVFKCSEIIETWYISQLRSKYISVIKMIAYTIMGVYRILLLAYGKGVVWFAFATSIDVVVMAILYIPLYLRQNNPKLRIRFNKGKSLLTISWHYIVSGLMTVVYSQVDRIMLKHFVDERSVGLYSAAFNIYTVWLFVPNSIVASAQPIIMEYKKKDEKTYRRRLMQLYSGIFWLGVVVALPISFFSDYIIKLLYGADFADAGSALRVGIWFGVFASLGTARGVWILSENMNKYIKYFLFGGALIDVILGFVLIKPFGIIGAAVAALVAQFFIAFLAPLFHKDTRVHTKILLEAISLSWLRA